MSSPITIITPLAYEARALRATTHRYGWTLLTCGPGAQGIERLAMQCKAPTGHTIVLAGLAGGLDPRLAAGDLIVPEVVLSSDGERFTPPLQLPTAAGILSSVNEICDSLEAKASQFAESGAHAVDMESAHFATLAVERGWRWGIVRGISDPAGTTLPKSCARWVSSDGKLRPLPLLKSLLKDPKTARTLLRLNRSSSKAMASVARGLAELLAT